MRHLMRDGTRSNTFETSVLDKSVWRESRRGAGHQGTPASPGRHLLVHPAACRPSQQRPESDSDRALLDNV
eukprot:11333480-Karenia_brevis.AAC.1